MKKLISYLVENPDIKFILSNGVCRINKIDNAKAIEVQSIIESENLFLSLNGIITSVNIYKIPAKAIATPIVAAKKK